MDTILHICQKEAWELARQLGVYQAESLKLEGFIHCSRPEQVLKVASTYFLGVNDLVLLWIDPGKLTGELRWEDSEGDVFPHIYGSLNLDAVIAVVDFPPDADGFFRTLPQPG